LQEEELTVSLEKLINFSEIIGKLKVVNRSGWVSHVGITNPESVADHSFRCAILAMCIGDLLSVNTEKLIRMLLLHDIQESVTGDYDYYAKEEIGTPRVKLQERIAIKDILSRLPAKLKRKYDAIWREFEDKTTSEAMLANDIDKIEMLIQALEYEKKGYDPEKLEVFWTSSQDKIKTALGQDLFKLLRGKRTSSPRNCQV
jgi:putative hydrolase of HD superfamily